MPKNKSKYIYIVIAWGEEPIVYRTKISLVNHFNKSNSRVVDSWFESKWFTLIDNSVVIKVDIPKVKSKIRK